MKSALIAVGMVMSFGVLNAGGNVSPVAPIAEPSTHCGSNDVYVENNTNLMWQDQAYTNQEDAAYKREHSHGKAGSWKHAMRYCQSLDYAGYRDWRLPTADELSHMHRHFGQLFKHYRGDDFWTSTTTVENKYYVVYPVDAYLNKRHPNQSNYIRCVRCLTEAEK